jgi:hypothetical protein
MTDSPLQRIRYVPPLLEDFLSTTEVPADADDGWCDAAANGIAAPLAPVSCR